jgi:DNA-binding NarL/FixJ family response regulator
MNSGRQCARQSRQTGAAGYVLKDARSGEMISAIKALAETLTGYTSTPQTEH